MNTPLMTCSNATQDPTSATFLALLMAIKCLLTNQCLYPQDRPDTINQKFDYIIVGAGSAGSVVANRLSENPKTRVLVLEAGAYPTSRSEIPALHGTLKGTKIDWNYTTQKSDRFCVGFKDGVCSWPRGRCLGGSSTINAMLYVRGHRKDYDQWANNGNQGWDYDSIVKYFHKSEDLQEADLKESTQYGRGGYQPIGIFNSQEAIKNIVKNAVEELGFLPRQEEGQFGFFNALQTIDRGVRANTGKQFLGGKFKSRSNLFVKLNSQVETVVFDKENKNYATGVIVTVNGKRLTFLAEKEVIISAGSINSPQILMNSGIGPQGHLKKLKIPLVQDLPVGKNLQDHAIFLGLLIRVSSAVYEEVNNPLSDGFNYFLKNRGSLGTTGGLLNLLGFINTKNDSDIPNMQFHHKIYPSDDISHFMASIGAKIGPNFCQNISNSNSLLNIMPTLLHPESRGEILLNSSNPLDKPLIFPNYFDKSQDKIILLQGIRFVERLIETEAFRGVNAEIIELPMKECQGLKFRSDEYWGCMIATVTGTVFHPVGSCKMGPSWDSEAVVDPRLRVYGLESLRVVDASVMPEIVGGNTNGAAIMIGQKGADMIVEDDFSFVK